MLEDLKFNLFIMVDLFVCSLKIWECILILFVDFVLRFFFFFSFFIRVVFFVLVYFIIIIFLV